MDAVTTKRPGGIHTRDRSRRDVTGWLIAGFVAACQFVVAGIASYSMMAAAAVIGAIIIAVACFLWPAAMMVGAFPSMFATWRIGPSGIGMSVADVMTAVGTAASLPYVPWKHPAFRRALGAMSGYVLLVSISVVANPSLVAAVEVAHRFMLVIGSICIGTAIVRTGHVTAALRAFVIAGCVVSIAEISYSLTHGFEAAYALGLQKNTGGALLMMCFLVIFLAGKRLEWRRSVMVVTAALVLGGLAATQSRGSGLALIAVLVVYGARSAYHGRIRRLVRFAPLFLALALALGSITYVTLSNTQHKVKKEGSGEQFTSIGSRETTFDLTINRVIKPHPFFGAGPKWFVLPGTPTNEPHNVVLDEIASVGGVGFIGFILLLWALFHAMRGGRDDLTELGWYALVGRVLATMTDIFWVAGPGTLPFLLVGLAIGSATGEGIDSTRRHRLRLL